ncbi:MAG: hypothetical protein ABFC38_06555 [Methanospirillum sp.]
MESWYFFETPFSGKNRADGVLHAISRPAEIGEMLEVLREESRTPDVRVSDLGDRRPHRHAGLAGVEKPVMDIGGERNLLPSPVSGPKESVPEDGRHSRGSDQAGHDDRDKDIPITPASCPIRAVVTRRNVYFKEPGSTAGITGPVEEDCYADGHIPAETEATKTTPTASRFF